MVQLIELLHGHIHTHVQLDCDLIRTWYRKIFAVRMEIAEIGKNSKPLGF